MKNITLILCLFFLSLFVIAQIPEGYYDLTEGKEGESLRQSLHGIIKDHDQVSYGQLHDKYEYTDKKTNGKVWDMYSDVPGGILPYEYSFGETCGNYNEEGDCYNREHSFPKSWFGGKKSPMYTDIFHVIPTDGFVNGKRYHWVYGEINNPSWVSQNGCKLGYNSYPGSTYEDAFEPIDTYKGDFARIYFYMLTRYYDKITTWPDVTTMLSGNNFSDWAKTMLIEWHTNDPVSQKEIDRNNAIYTHVQGNRNPFVDHPEYAGCIWNNNCNTSISNNPLSNKFFISPNPINETAKIEFYLKKSSVVNICIYNIIGEKKEVLQINGITGKNTHNISINKSNLQKGLYFIHLEIGKDLIVKKILIN